MNKILTFSLSILLATAFVGCGKTEAGDDVQNGTISIEADVYEITNNGTDIVTFTVSYKDDNGQKQDITADADIFMLPDEATPLGTNTFSSTTVGAFKFYAVYQDKFSKVISVSVIPIIPADPQENSTDFRHRMLLLQHTGSGCGYCPIVISILEELSELQDYKDSYNHVALHAYNPDDKAYTSDASEVSNFFGSGSFPYLTYNLTAFSAPQTLDGLKKGIDSYRKDAAEIGICAASAVLENKEIIVNVEVKAAVVNTYRISVWLLQDGIYSRQNDYDTGVFEPWMNTHNNCLMKMAGNGAQTKIYGRNIGNVAAGTKVSGIYRIDVDPSWNLENCKLLILANGKNREIYDVSNSVVCPVNGSVAYDYNSAE